MKRNTGRQRKRGTIRFTVIYPIFNMSTRVSQASSLSPEPVQVRDSRTWWRLPNVGGALRAANLSPPKVDAGVPTGVVFSFPNVGAGLRTGESSPSNQPGRTN